MPKSHRLKLARAIDAPSLLLVNIYRILYSLRYVILLFFTSTRVGCALKNCPFARQDANYNSGGFRT